MPDPDCDKDCEPHGDAVYETETVPHELADTDSDGIIEPEVLTDGQFELVPEVTNEPVKIAELDGRVDGVLIADSDTETVLQGDGVRETDTVPHALDNADGDDIVESDGLSVPLLQLVNEGLSVGDTVGEFENTVEIVGNVEGVLITEGDKDCDPHGDAVKVDDTVPHALGEVDGIDVVETDGLTDPLARLVADATTDADTTDDGETEIDIVGDSESVPDPDCDRECVPQADAEKVIDTVPHGLADTDGDCIGEPDALYDETLEIVPDEEKEVDSVDEIVEDVECVPDFDCAKEPVPQCDAVLETVRVPHELDDADGDDIVELDGLCVPLMQTVTDEL